jgi:ATP-binding cassette subfamily C protein LapB
MAFVINIIGLFSSIFALQVYDRVVAKGGDSTLTALALGMAVAIVFDFVLRNSRAALMRKVGAQVEVTFARGVYQRLTQLPALELEKRPPAFWQSMFRDVELIRTTTTGAPALLLIDLPFTLLSLLLIAVIAPPLLPVGIVIVISFTALAWWSEKVIRNAAEVEKERVVARDTMLGEISASRMQLKASGDKENMNSRWQENYALWMREALDRSKDADRFRDISQAMTMAATVLMTSYGATVILQQQMTMGALIAANILTGKLVGPMVQLVSQWRSFGQYKSAKKRMSDLFDIEIEPMHAPVELERPQGEIKFDQVVFSYPGSADPQISEVSGRLGAGGMHAIVGSNGSGKTTLLKLIRGLYQSEHGQVLIDGVDIKQLGQVDLARWIGYLPQQPRLVLGSIRDNLVLGADDPSDEQILEACRRAIAYDFIVSLPEGFDTDVGEAGSRFSSGQRKRIAIAQTLINDPPILLLDEPTSDLDSTAEKSFVASMKELSKDHTVIMVTHSPEVLKNCDGIVVMDSGKVALAGPAGAVLPKIGFSKQSGNIAGDAA